MILLWKVVFMASEDRSSLGCFDGRGTSQIQTLFEVAEMMVNE